jgi:hypothetical protein
MSSLRDALVRTAMSYLSGFNTPGSDLNGTIASRAPDCVHRILPSNLGIPALGKDQYRNYSKRIRTFVENFRLEQIAGTAPVVDENATKVMLSIKSSGDSPFGPYAGEYFTVLRMTKDGTMINEITEFLDSDYTLKFLSSVGMASLASGI